MNALSPAASRAEEAGRATAQVPFVVVGLVLIVLHFTQRKKGGRKTAARQSAVEREVLVPYADVQREIEALKAHPDAEGEFVAQLTRFTALRSARANLRQECRVSLSASR